MAVRGCLELGLQNLDEKCTVLDQQTRARLWNTTVFLKVQQAANSGTPLLLRRCDIGHYTLRNLDDDELVNDAVPGPASEYTESACEIIISRALPIAIDVVSMANSTISAVNTLDHYQTDLKRLFQDVQAIYADERAIKDVFDWRKPQKHMLTVYLRRILLIVHQTSLSLSSDTMTRAHLQKQFLGSALAIMVHQRQLFDDGDCFALKMVAELFKQDFFIAAVGACMTLRSCQQETAEGLELAASKRDTILEALYWCKELWLRDVHISTCNYWAYLILERLLDGLVVARANAHESAQPSLNPAVWVNRAFKDNDALASMI
ncbi:hypothetical protein V2A60_006853 [Cordyceps javanica]